MKIQKLTSLAAVVAVLAITMTSAKALTFNQVQEIKKKVLGAPVPEMPVIAAELVLKAEKKDRQATAVVAVRAIVLKHRAAAPLVISAISKIAPDLSPAVAVAAAEVATEQAQMIARAAASAAPEQAKEINLAVAKVVPTTSASTSVNAPSVSGSTTPGTFITRAGASSGGASHGTPVIRDTPINRQTGGNGTGVFGSTPPASSGPGVVIYNQPPQ